MTGAFPAFRHHIDDVEPFPFLTEEEFDELTQAEQIAHLARAMVALDLTKDHLFGRKRDKDDSLSAPEPPPEQQAQIQAAKHIER